MKFSFSRLLTPETAGLHHLGDLAEAMDEAVDLLSQLMGADRSAAEQLDTRLGAVEASASSTHMAMMTSLRSAFVTPLPRKDLYEISSLLNVVVGHLCNVGFVIRASQQYRLNTDAMELLEVLGQQARLVRRAMHQLRDFDDLEETWIEMSRLARRSERMVTSWIMEEVEESMPRTYHARREVAHAVEKTLTVLRQMIMHLGGVLVRES